jgi:hypothetical protein
VDEDLEFSAASRAAVSCDSWVGVSFECPPGPPGRNVPLFSAVSRAADSPASCEAVSFDLKAPGLGDGEAAARKLLAAPPRPAAEAATTPTKTIAAVTTAAISNMRPVLIRSMVGGKAQETLGIACEF